MGTDNGPPFSGHQFTNFARKLGFKHTKVTPYAPWANDTVEHFMQNLGKVLRTTNVENRDWRTALLAFFKAYRATPHTTTSQAPAHLLFNGRKYNTKLPDAETEAPLTREAKVRHMDHQRKQTAKLRADAKHHLCRDRLKIGDKVLCRQLKKNKVTTPNAYIITEINGSQITARNGCKQITRHITFFKQLRAEPRRQEQESYMHTSESETDQQPYTESSEDEGASEEDEHKEIETDSETIPYMGEEEEAERVTRGRLSFTIKQFIMLILSVLTDLGAKRYAHFAERRHAVFN